MTTEDHAGDVIRKARQGLKISAEKVASIAKVDTFRLKQYEFEGAPLDGIDLAAVAQLLNLNGTSLQGLADGWEPQDISLAQWPHVEVIEGDTGGMSVNCFLVWDEATKQAALFDTGWIAEPITRILERHDLSLKYIFLTHAHNDHIAALEELRKLGCQAPIYARQADAPDRIPLAPEDRFRIGDLSVTWCETPGHTADGITFVVEGFPEPSAPVAMVGDAIFAGSIGGAMNHFELAKTRIAQQILSLPPGTLICPGHGPLTTVGEQLEHNPFFVGRTGQETSG